MGESSSPEQLVIAEKYRYPREFVDIQVKFAQKWSQLSGEQLSTSLLEHTFLYKMITGKKFKAGEPINDTWHQMIAGLPPSESNLSDSIFDFYLQQPRSRIKTQEEKPIFDVTLDSRSNTAEIHFQEFKPHVFQKFNSLIDQLKESGVANIYTCSWINDLLSSDPRFSKFFPESYFHNMQEVEDQNFRGISLWGQFLSSDHSIKNELTTTFVSSVEDAHTLDDLESSFPFHTRATQIPISDFK